MIDLKDRFNRVHDYLRVSLTDRCNLNCLYCNPKSEKENQKTDILRYEDLTRIIGLFVKRLGVKKIRFTGGEPFARKDVMDFFKSLSALKAEHNLTFGVTTNGTMINGKLKEIRESGIDKINISLDTLNPDKFRRIAGKSVLKDVLNAIIEAQEENFRTIKINSVIIRGVNDDEILSFIEYFKYYNVHLRFIEFMPSQNNSWGMDGYMSAEEIKNIIVKEFNLIETSFGKHSVSKNYQIQGSPLSIGLITPISDHFCDSCNRLRITAAGEFKTCLFWTRTDDVNFRNLISYNYSDEDICALIVNSLRLKWKTHPGLSKLTQMQENNMLQTGG